VIHLKTLLLATFIILLGGSGVLAQEKPCNFLKKAEAESIVGASLVARRDNDGECWFVQDGFSAARVSETSRST
jgi:hypothetical protein